ncbi:hypothetical protein [Nocardioides sp. 503]|uniref:WXG100 family type VII secretion target n=1 Tax=Nocardioides sp. 503 TaxID=2508326 RepID=UPI00106FC671|nr:hypothetical protein [Nocardioides sp. 503]
MTTYDYYQDYNDDVDTKIQELSDKIEEGVQKVIDTFNDTIGSSNWAWISPGLKIAYNMAKDKIEEEIEHLWNEFTKFCEDMWAKVEEMTGNPFHLMDMNASYLKAAGRIRDEKMVVDSLLAEVTKTWSGDAFISYRDAATRQKNAINAVDTGLVSAATACAEGAKELREVWRIMVDVLLDVVNAILDAIKDGTDAGQWVTFDAGPAIKVIGKIVTAALDLWNRLDAYFDSNVTVKLSMWRNLNEGLDGLNANNDWPVLSSRYTDEMNDKGKWTHT